MAGGVNAGGDEAVVNARVRAENKTISWAMTNPYTKQDERRCCPPAR
jgi:hypothetical protein